MIVNHRGTEDTEKKKDNQGEGHNEIFRGWNTLRIQGETDNFAERII